MSPLVDLEVERRKAQDFLAGVAGVKVELVRQGVRTGLNKMEVEKEWLVKKEKEQTVPPLQRIEQYRKSIKEQ